MIIMYRSTTCQKAKC